MLRKLALLTVLVTVTGGLVSGCGGPKPTKEEEAAPPSRGPGTPSGASGGPSTGGTASGMPGGPGTTGVPAMAGGGPPGSVGGGAPGSSGQ